MGVLLGERENGLSACIQKSQFYITQYYLEHIYMYILIEYRFIAMRHIFNSLLSEHKHSKQNDDYSTFHTRHTRHSTSSFELAVVNCVCMAEEGFRAEMYCNHRFVCYVYALKTVEYMYIRTYFEVRWL